VQDAPEGNASDADVTTYTYTPAGKQATVADNAGNTWTYGYNLLMLGLLDTDYSEALVDQLVSASLSHRNALRVRQILGRLPHDQAERIVPPAVWRQLHQTDDYDAYRRMAELLSHLGLYGALGELSAEALKSSDPDIREVGDDFAR